MYYIRHNPNYELKWRVLIRVAAFIEGVISVLTLGFVGTNILLSAYSNATLDYLKEKRAREV